MNKTQLLEAITSKANSTFGKSFTKSDVNALLLTFETVATNTLKSGEEVPLAGLGKLKVSQKAARTGRNPQTGAAIDIPAKTVVKFSPAKALTDAIN